MGVGQATAVALDLARVIPSGSRGMSVGSYRADHLRASEVAAGGARCRATARTAAKRAAGRAGRTGRAGRAGRVASRFVGATGHGVAGLVNEVATLFLPVASLLRSATIPIGCHVAQVARLLADGAAQFRAGLRCEQ